jgi:hypothetical protein
MADTGVTRLATQLSSNTQWSITQPWFRPTTILTGIFRMPEQLQKSSKVDPGRRSSETAIGSSMSGGGDAAAASAENWLETDRNRQGSSVPATGLESAAGRNAQIDRDQCRMDQNAG